MKFKTIRQGEQAIIYNHLGVGKIVEGPHRVFLFRQRLSKLNHYGASQYQYLRVTFCTGNIEHIPGPHEMFKNPLEHNHIEVKDSVKIDANHMIVVYRRLQNNSVERRIVQGPTLFMPQAEEWLHDFSWHGQDTAQVGHMVQDRCQFQQLAAIPDQFYYNVKEVRTTDDTMLTVKLMIFYELKDVITMLQATHDPVADMINAVCSDVIAFAGRLTFQQFLSQTNKLSELTAYPQLIQRTTRIGYKVNKVVYRGYQASDQLQAMQDNAIQSRTELRLDAELQEQKQKLIDFKLQKEQERTNMTQTMEKKRVEHRQNVDQMKKNHQMALNEESLDIQLECQKMRHDATLENQQKSSEQQIGFLKNLHDLEVDLTQFLTNQGPGKIDQELHLIPRTSADTAV